MKRGVRLGLLLGVALTIAAGCAPTNVQQQNMTLTQLPRPDLVLVYDFAVSPDEVTLDTGLSAELMRKYEQHKGASPTAQEIKLGHKVAETVAASWSSRSAATGSGRSGLSGGPRAGARCCW